MKKEYLIYKLSEEMKEATRIDTALFPIINSFLFHPAPQRKILHCAKSGI